MSSDSQCQTLSEGALRQLYDDVIEHMKIDGTYDNIRMKQVDPIQNESDFQYIIDELKLECDSLCKNFDLSQHRNTLRKELESKLDFHSTSKNKLKELITRALKNQEEDLKALFFKGAEKFLRDKFLQQPQEEIIEKVDDDSRFETENENQAETDMDIDESSMDENDDADLEIERPPYSPIGNGQAVITEEVQSAPIVEVKIEDIRMPNTPQPDVNNQEPNIEHITTEPCLDEIPIPPEEEDSKEPSNYSTPEEEIKKENPSISEQETTLPPDEDSDDLEKLTFSSVSTIDTADLNELDFDNSIRLSDDEASLIGKPKNSKVPLEVVQGQFPPIDSESILETKKTYEHQERIDYVESTEVNESDEGCSESTVTGRRAARTRKSNPRYSNGDYKLL